MGCSQGLPGHLSIVKNQKWWNLGVMASNLEPWEGVVLVQIRSLPSDGVPMFRRPDQVSHVVWIKTVAY